VLVEQELLAGLMRECCLHYLDDIWVYLRSWPEYIHHLSQVFECLSIYSLTYVLKKCTFRIPELEYLGHVVTGTQNKANPEPVQAIFQASTPRSKKNLRAFFSTCGWLREYVPDFTSIVLPRNALLAQKRVWKWTKKALSKLSSACSNDPDPVPP
jgi:hypothetical protein